MFVACALGVFPAHGHAQEPSTSAAQIPAIRFVELSRKVIELGDRTVTLVRVRPPVLPSATPIAKPALPSPEQVEEAQRIASKQYVSLGLAATVYLRAGLPTITLLSWTDETTNRRFEAWSNADFRYLANLGRLETNTQLFDLLMLNGAQICDVDAMLAEEKPRLPNLPFETGLYEYYVISSDDGGNAVLLTQEPVLEGLDYLHGLYQLRHRDLKADYERREADNAARAEKLARNSPEPAGVTTYFWPIKNNSSER